MKLRQARKLGWIERVASPFFTVEEARRRKWSTWVKAAERQAKSVRRALRAPEEHDEWVRALDRKGSGRAYNHAELS